MEYTLLSVRLESVWAHLNHCVGCSYSWTNDGHFQIFRNFEVSLPQDGARELVIIFEFQSERRYRNQGYGHRKT